MRKPVVVVTGGIATGKTTVARVIAACGGALIDCDAIGHEALETAETRARIERTFGKGVMTASGRVSRSKLGRLVFSDLRRLETLNRLIRPVLKRMIRDEVARCRETADYIVLDAVLYFQYKFRFKVDLVIQTTAAEGRRLERLMTRNGMDETAARRRIAGQESLMDAWSMADITVRTDGSMERVVEEAAEIRDSFLAAHRIR